jgi:Amt family ammonium transporter
VEPWAAIVIGLAAGLVCWAAVDLKARLKYDDSLDVVGVHMVGGIVGALLVGLLASTAINEFSVSGLGQLGTQAIGVGATLGFSFVATWIILWVVDKVIGLRVTEEDEITGLDLSQHAEVGYTLVDRGGSVGEAAPGGGSSTVVVREPAPVVKEGAR